MISLGACDTGVTKSQCDAYVKQVEAATRVSLSQIEATRDRITFAPHTPDAQQPMTVASIQKALRELGFFPGGKDDGICGYRTLSAIRLFQEYVRAIEKLPSVPDGVFGPSSQQHLQRWIDKRLSPEWTPAIERWKAGTLADTEYSAWLLLLDAVKAHYTAQPNKMLQMVNAFAGPSDTRKVAAWDASPAGIHIIGIRRNEATQKFDDIFVLLIKGLVFKFQGTTEPGASENAAGAPFLVQGQHDYHFGWHKSTYLALRPLGKGVLVVRSKDFKLDDTDLNNGLEANATINVHWGGKGKTADIKTWSEGCQVINGSAYLTPTNALIDCSAFVAVNNGEVASTPSKTRGAYNVLLDVVTALGSDLPSNTVRYSLLAESDLDLAPALKKGLADARDRARSVLG